MDFIAIEILKKDGIKVDTFEISDNYIKKGNKGIIIPFLGENKKVELSQGIMNYSDNKRFFHNCNIPGNLCVPILLKNNIKIIGIHSGYNKIKNEYTGIYFHHIFLNPIENEPNIKKDFKDCKD